MPAPDFVAIGQNVVVVLGENDRVNSWIRCILQGLRRSRLSEVAEKARASSIARRS